MPNAIVRLCVVGALLASACASEVVGATEPPLPDRAMFEDTVYPLLMRDCGFSECHGAEQRFFQVFGPGRSRLEGHPSDPDLAPRERQRTYDRARSMLVFPGGASVLESSLLTKPLELNAGGASHGGVDRFGRNVFQSMSDARYLTLVRWAGYMPPSAAAPTPAPVVPPEVPPGAAPGVTRQPLVETPDAAALDAMPDAEIEP